MAEFVFPDSNVEDPRALWQACVTFGIFDAIVTLDDAVATITTNVAVWAQADQAVALAAAGTVFADGTLKIAACEDRTKLLQEEGYDWTRPSDGTVKPSVDRTFDGAETFQTIATALDAGTLVPPIPISTLDGRGFMLDTVADGDALYIDTAMQVEYLLGAKVNGDGSLGEAAFIGAVTAAVQADDRAALDAIVDTRV